MWRDEGKFVGEDEARLASRRAGRPRAVVIYVEGESAMNTCVNPAPVEQPASTSAWPSVNGGATVVTGVLKISGMPRSLRSEIERAMDRCIRTESEFIIPGDDPLTAQWCTRWFRDGLSVAALARGGKACAHSDSGIGCHQVLTGTREELDALDCVVRYLAQRHGFTAAVRLP